MGAIELQVFVGLVVILGAAFVALICDFLKGNNEQLRESNIELKVRQDERDRRDQLVQEVQRQTIEVVAQIQRASGQRVAPVTPAAAARGAKADPVKVEPVQATVMTPVKDARTLFAEAEQARQGRGRRERRRMAETAPVERPAAPVEPQSPAAWAQEVYLRRFPQAESRRAASEAVAEPASSEKAATLNLQPVPAKAEIVQPEIVVTADASPTESQIPEAPPVVLQAPEECVAAVAEGPAPVVEATPGMVGKVSGGDVPVQWQARLRAGSEALVGAPEPALPTARAAAPEAALAAASPVMMEHAPVPSAAGQVQSGLGCLGASTDTAIPNSGLSPVVPEIAPEAQPAGEEEVVPAANVVRIRVLREEDLVVEAASAVQAAGEIEEEVVAQTEPLLVETAGAVEQEPEPVAGAELAVEEELPLPAEPGSEFQEIVPEQDALPELEASTWRWEETPDTAEPAWLEVPVETESFEPQPAEELAAETVAQLEELPAEQEPAVEAAPVGRSNLVEMPAVSASRAQEAEPAVPVRLAVPGGYHEPQALARLMEEEAPFQGLVMVVSLVDYVRLLADQGKPAMEQLMGAVSRQVVSMTREQDFACRIGEDEFVLVFAQEGGAAAKRRIQFVAERLWDFQLRSLGSMSVLFSWGAAETAGEPLSRTVERAREQMIETRRGRRSQTIGTGRFRRVAND